MEGNVLKRIQLELTKLRNVRLFRNNTGQGWQGRSIWETQTKLVLHNPRPLTAGLVKGSSDLIGWVSVEITPDMVGKRVAVFTAIEVKTAGTATTKEQAAFLSAVRMAGGRAGIAHDVPGAFQVCTQIEI